MIFDVLVILFAIIGGGLLLFPVKVRFSFRGQKNGNHFSLHLFRKKVWSSEEENPLAEEERASEETENISEENRIADEEIRASKEDRFDDENPWKKEETVEAKPEISQVKEAKKAETMPKENPSKPGTKKSKKKTSKSSAKDSDVEFLTLILEPGFDRKILKSSFRMSRSFFRIFHCYFEPTIVDGLRFGDYEDMGYAMGGLNFMCGVIPLFHNWQFWMDWEGNRPLRIEGGFVASFSIARILGFGLVSSISIVELVLMYLINRHRYKKNPESFRLVFWRRWIVRFLCKN